MLKKLKSMLIFLSKEKATIGIKISKLFFKDKVKQCAEWLMFSCRLHGSCSTWPRLPELLLHPTRGEGTPMPQELFNKTPKRILSMLNVLGCTRCFLRLLFASPCQHAAKLFSSGSEGRKQNSFSISSVLTSKEEWEQLSADGNISHVSSFLSPVFSEIRWNCWILNVDISTA